MFAGVSVPWTIFTLVYLAVLFLLGFSQGNGFGCDIFGAVVVRVRFVKARGPRRAVVNRKWAGSDPAVSTLWHTLL